MKKLASIALAATACLALAAVTVIGAKGTGVVTNPAGKTAGFRFEGTKTTDGTRVAFAGQGLFTTRIERDGRVGQLQILLHKVLGVGKTGNSAVIEGQGVRRVTFGTTTVETPGRVRIACRDRRAPGGTGEPDLYSIRFAASATDVFEFGGKVTSGDLVVFERTGP